MARAIHVFRTPDRFVAGTVGQPGNRTFYLQAVHDKRVISVILEKQQVAVLAERIAALLLEINRRFGTPIPPETDDRGPEPAGHARRRRVPGRHDGPGLGFRGADGGGRAAGGLRYRVRCVGGARRRRGRARRGARVPHPRVRASVRDPVQPGHLGGPPAVPAVRRAPRSGGPHLRAHQRLSAEPGRARR